MPKGSKELTSPALTGIRVLDLTEGIAGSYCSKLMAGFGAEVVKVEPSPAGDPLRSLGPFRRDREGVETSIPFLWLNTGKKSLTLDLESAEGREIFKHLAQASDVVLESFPPGRMAKLGLGYDALAGRHPALVMTSISPFGQTGPYRDFAAEEITLAALCGGMHLTGDPQQAPLKPGPEIYQYTAGQHAYVATLMALWQRDLTGRGAHVDLSIQESGLEHIEIALSYALQEKRTARRGKHMFVPWDMYEGADGHAVIIAMPYRHWHRAAEIFPEPGLFAARFHRLQDRIARREEFEALLRPCVKARPVRELFHQGQTRQLAFGYLAGLEEVLDSPQHAARAFFETAGHPAIGEHSMCGAPFRMSETPWQTGRAPLLGEHNQEILAQVGPAPAAGAGEGAVRESRQASPPLDGIRVLDLSHSWAAPHCARLLADFGAEVIKVEYLRRLCLLRGGRTDAHHYDTHPGWRQVNRNKMSITLDLKKGRDREALEALIRDADVLIENSRPGVLDRLGLGHEDLARIRPDLIRLSMSAFGRTGPWASYVGYGAVFEALGGIQSLTAYEKGGRTFRVKEMDITNGLAGACAVMTALIHRRRTGRGQSIDLSQLEAATHALIGEHLLEAALNRRQPLPLGNRHRHYAPQGCYPCRGDDRWAVLTVRSEAEWGRFCTALEHPEWRRDPRFHTLSARRAHHDALDRLIAAWTRERTPAEVMHLLQGHGIPAGAVLDVLALAEDPHLARRGYYVHEVAGSTGPLMGMPFRLEQGAGAVRRAGPALGRDNETVLCGRLGWSRADLPPIVPEKIRTAFDPE